MCTLFIYRKKSSNWPLLIASNRDESFHRSYSSPNYHWKSSPDIFAGKDLLKGGSWMGINKKNLFATILNREKTNISINKTSSRGELVIKALRFNCAVEASKNIFNNLKKVYNNFNLFIGDARTAFWIKLHNGNKEIYKVPFGFSVMDKYNLNDSKSKKQKLYKNIFKKIKVPIPEESNFKDWQRLLFMKKRYNNLINTEVFVCNNKTNYGTVSSSIIGIPKFDNKKLSPFWLYNDKKNENKKFVSLSPFRSKDN